MKKLSLQIMVLIITFMISGSLTAQNSDNSDFKPSGNVWGYVFGDYYYKQHSDSAGRGASNVQYSPTKSPVLSGNGANAFQLRRAYLGYDYNITPKLSAYTVLANEQDIDNSGYNTTYLKYAYLKYSGIFKGSNLFIGQMPTPSFAMTPYGTEPLWGYRADERTIMDMHNLDPSTDLGAALQGNLWKGKASNDTIKPTSIGYEFMIANGTGAKPAASQFKKFRGTVYANFLNEQLTIGLYGDYMRTQLDPIQMYAATYKVYANYKTRIFKIGFEAFMQEDQNSDVDTIKKVKYYTSGMQQGVSVFLSGKILKKLNYFARVDQYNPDSKFNSSHQQDYVSTDYGSISGTKTAAKVASVEANTSSYKQTFVTAGLDYTITPRIHIMPNIWYNQYNSSLSGVSGKEKQDYDMVPRITFYFVFNTAKKINNNGMDY